MNNIAHCCFWVEGSLSSWEPFLADNHWDFNAVGKTLVTLLVEKGEDQRKRSRRLSGGSGYSLKGIPVITRMRKDGVAWEQRIESQSKKSPQDKGKWKVAHLLPEFLPEKLWVNIYGRQVLMEVVEREVFIGGFEPRVKVVVTQGKKEPIIFLSTDLSLSATQIIEIYGAGFSIELAIRDLKQHFGLGHYQCYLGIAIDRFVNLACIAYCLLGLFQQEQLKSESMLKISRSNLVLSFSGLRQGLQHFAISRILFPKSAPEADLQPQSSELDQILRLVA